MAGSCPIMRDRRAFTNSSTRGVFASVSSKVLSPSFAEFISNPLLKHLFSEALGSWKPGSSTNNQYPFTSSYRFAERNIPASLAFGAGTGRVRIVCCGIKGTLLRSSGIAKTETTRTDLLAPGQRVPLHLDVA